jgi:soluble lytic murein transglycosylase-like protein
MSIESVQLRIAEIQDRISALQGLGSAPATVQVGLNLPLNGSAPFDVTLAQRLGNASVRPAAAPQSGRIETALQNSCAEYGVDINLARAVMQVESDGNPKCVSSKGAMGLMQLMPEEVRAYGIKDPFDIEENIRGGVRQLSEKLRIFGGNLQLTLAAYNAGTGAVNRYGGIPPYPETQNYVRKVMRLLGR